MEIFKDKAKVYDLIVLIIINVFAVATSFAIEANFLTSTLLFLGFPSLFLLFRERKHLTKILIATFSFGVLFSFCFDYIAELNSAWEWYGGLYFGKILGVVQVDVLIWFCLWIFHIFLFYEHFIDKNKLKDKISERGKISFVIAGLTLTALLTCHTFFPTLLIFPKAYLILSLLVSLQFLTFLFIKKSLVFHTFKILPYFFFVYMSHEITSLQLRQWSFPGDYIGMMHMFGVSFPIEEFVFWIILSSVVGATYYEYVFDNEKQS